MMKTTMKRKVAATLAAVSLMTIGTAAMTTNAVAEVAAPAPAYVQTVQLRATDKSDSEKTLEQMGKDILEAAQKTTEAAKKKDESKVDLLVDTAKNVAPVVGDVVKYTGQKIAEGAKSAWNWFTGLF